MYAGQLVYRDGHNDPKGSPSPHTHAPLQYYQMMGCNILHPKPLALHNKLLVADAHIQST